MSPTGDIGDDDRALAAEYALGLLDPTEARAFEARMAQEPALREAYAEWAEAFIRMEPDDSVSPPPGVWAGVQARLFADPRPRRRWLGWVTALGLAAAVVAFVAVQTGMFQPFEPDFRAELTSDASPLRIVATYASAEGTLNLTRVGGTGPAAGRSHELWVIPTPDAAPVSLGLLDAGEGLAVTVPEPLRGAMPGATLAVSDEPEGGAPGGAPTGAILAAGTVSEL